MTYFKADDPTWCDLSAHLAFASLRLCNGFYFSGRIWKRRVIVCGKNPGKHPQDWHKCKRVEKSCQPSAEEISFCLSFLAIRFLWSAEQQVDLDNSPVIIIDNDCYNSASARLRLCFVRDRWYLVTTGYLKGLVALHWVIFCPDGCFICQMSLCRMWKINTGSSVYPRKRNLKWSGCRMQCNLHTAQKDICNRTSSASQPSQSSALTYIFDLYLERCLRVTKTLQAFTKYRGLNWQLTYQRDR